MAGVFSIIRKFTIWLSIAVGLAAGINRGGGGLLGIQADKSGEWECWVVRFAIMKLVNLNFSAVDQLIKND